MPYVQPLPWTEFMACPICTHNFGFYRRHPISLGCGHSVCRLCLASLYNQQCPFDQSPITVDHKNLPVNSALLRLASLRSGGNCALSEILSVLLPPCVRELKSDDLQCFHVGKACIEHMAMHLHKAIGNAENPLSRSMQRKLVTLINCQLMTEEGRLRAMRVSRCIGERAVIEMIMRQQKPIQLNSCLWAAVRGRGCQFLGPVLQEDLLRHLLAALDGGVALSRKSLVMQVVQSLKSEYSQASKTSVGHVVQLLYRASCFNVSKRECESSLMQLKEEFSTYDSLRQEHDAQIVQIAMEAGLRIPPEQWSTLLYGDLVHKSYMQSIIDRLQTPESFKQSIQELVLTLQRNGDMGEFENMRPHLQDLANIEISADKPTPTSWPELGRTLHAIRKVVDGFVDFEIRCRKQAEDQRRQRNTGGVGSFSHAKTDMEPYRNENYRSMTEGEQVIRSIRPMLRPGVSTPSFPGPSNLQHPSLASFRNGSNIGISTPLQKRFEKQQQQQQQQQQHHHQQQQQQQQQQPTPNFKSHRPSPLLLGKSQKTTLVHPAVSSMQRSSSSIHRAPVAPPPGFEQLRLSQSNGKRSPCSSSNYSSSNSTKSNATSTSSKLNARTTMLQGNWAQKRNVNERQQLHGFHNAQLKLLKVTQSPSVDRIQKDKSSISLRERQQQPFQCQPSAVSSTSRLETTTHSNRYDIDSDARDRRQIHELQQRFNQVLKNSALKPHERSSSTTDSGVNSPSQSNADMIEIDLNAEQQIQKTEKSKSQQALAHRAWHLKPEISSLFSNSDRNRTDFMKPKMKNDFQNSDRFYDSGRHSEVKLDMPRSSPSANFVMEFPKSSQQLQLKVPNISTEKLREIWQVPPDQPEAKTIEEIWKPLHPQKQEQSELQKNLEDIWVRQDHPSTHAQQSLSDSQSNSFGSENGVNNPYIDWMFRHNYTCMEAAYLKLAERYPNVGIGPWTDCSSFTTTGNRANPINGVCSNNSVPPTAPLNMGVRPSQQRTPEPSNLGLSALRLIGSFDENYNPNVPETVSAPQSPPRKSALDTAIETYWKDAMETSLGLNTFLPPAKTTDLPYPVAEDMGLSQAMRNVFDWRDEFKQQSPDSVAAATQQPSP